MALNLKNPEVERLATDVARLTGESKTEAIRRALDERKRRLTGRSIAERRQRILRLLERDIWPTLPRGKGRRRPSPGPGGEEDRILGYGPDGV